MSLSVIQPPAGSPSVTRSSLMPEPAVERELTRRMARPQRHRLLHGHPLAAAMPRIAGDVGGDPYAVLPRARDDRGLLVGVLPHSFCNPAVTGCGYCTFPHESFTSKKAIETIASVIREIERALETRPDLAPRAVEGLYFGGGTANLSPPEPFRQLCRALARAFDLSGAEVTLEGIPAAFLNRRPPLIDIMLDELPARHFRISMGVQTFDQEFLKRMGRLGFGDADTFEEVVRLGHSKGLTVSGDFLFNLPGQTLEQMREDIQHADRIGLDHLGLYHLVLFEGLGTAWSKDPTMLAALPTHEQAFQNWVILRDMLEDLGFVQTTLTNFERRHFQGRPERFVYEELSYQPSRYDMLGFGPSAISFVDSGKRAVKVVNPERSSEYNAAVERGWPSWNRAFEYADRDLKALHLTRRLAALTINRHDHREFFGADPLDDFGTAIESLARRGLLTVTNDLIEPTDRGRFYADSIAGLLTWRGDARFAASNPPTGSSGTTQSDQGNVGGFM